MQWYQYQCRYPEWYDIVLGGHEGLRISWAQSNTLAHLGLYLSMFCSTRQNLILFSNNKCQTWLGSIFDSVKVWKIGQGHIWLKWHCQAYKWVGMWFWSCFPWREHVNEYYYAVLWPVLNGISLPRSPVEIPLWALLFLWSHCGHYIFVPWPIMTSQ